MYVHGYNTSFEEAARRCAQISYDLFFDGAPIFFSWPSQGRIKDYFTDGTIIDQTAGQLADFLVKLKREAGLQKFHIIAHSMGARGLIKAFLRISANPELRKLKAIATNTILAAPDIDQDVFLQLAEHVTKYSKSVTLYASQNDEALNLSKKVHGAARAGDSRPIMIIDKVDTVDASKLLTDFSVHSLFSNNRTVISDIFLIIKNGLKPAQRPLRDKKVKNGIYWYFPK